MLWAQMQGPMGPQGGAAMLGGLLGGLVCGVLIGTVVAAVILRAACWLYNKFVGDPSQGVPEPTMGKAMGIAFVTMIAQMGTQTLIVLLAGAGGVSPFVAQGFSMLVGFLVSSAMITAMLPTQFSKAVLVALLQYVVIIIVVIVIAVFFMILGVGMMGAFR